MQDIILKNGDVIEELSLISDNYFDMAVIDPPYLMNKTTGGISKTGFVDKWQGNLKGADKKASIQNDIKFEEWLPEVYRVMKENSHCYIWTNDKNLADLQRASEKVGFRLHNILIWKKNNCTPNRWYMKNWEFILFLYKGKAKGQPLAVGQAIGSSPISSSKLIRKDEPFLFAAFIQIVVYRTVKQCCHPERVQRVEGSSHRFHCKRHPNA